MWYSHTVGTRQLKDIGSVLTLSLHQVVSYRKQRCLFLLFPSVTL
jgi:hypothetical protein